MNCARSGQVIITYRIVIVTFHTKKRFRLLVMGWKEKVVGITSHLKFKSNLVNP